MLRMAHTHIETAVTGRRGHFAGTSPCSVYVPFTSAGTSALRSSATSYRRGAAGSQRQRGQPKPQNQLGTSLGLELRRQDLPDGLEAAEGKLPNWEKPARA